MLPPLVGSLLALSLGRRRADWRWLVLAGSLASLAVFTKPIAVLNAAVPLVALLPLARRAPRRAELLHALSFLAGGALVAAVVFAPFAALGRSRRLLLRERDLQPGVRLGRQLRATR